MPSGSPCDTPQMSLARQSRSGACVHRDTQSKRGRTRDEGEERGSERGGRGGGGEGATHLELWVSQELQAGLVVNVHLVYINGVRRVRRRRSEACSNQSMQ